ncbi:alpha/beta hydrolase [Aeromicrobium senzhongii]|uniref:Alpha/beta hydrolase n=1 Tax=Aeromicrobium senzhongii TaxID=2663859 RepID=A0ABX6SSA7_9ACTN|nr:alpha/beta hydrolase [Aeromicrobium senzhongii]MTB89590.1 alpha/beta fold hydrolase [Aeromicrobium senzhongii]QNL94283.1 alpha/beta hydrolase [Aeromicrobium senzhongii]
MTVPEWFRWALDQKPQHLEVEVDGVPIAYRAWGEQGDPVAVLVHGGAAHAGWWDHVAPHLAVGHRVLAPDLSGHGDSGRRDAYTLEAWAREILAVASAESAEKPVVFGHSMGGFVALTAAREHGADLLGAAAIDSPVQAVSPEARSWRADRAVLSMPLYPDAATMVSRFRTLPEDPSCLPYIRDHIARESIRHVDRPDGTGWTWKFDPRVFLRSMMEPDDVARSQCEVALLRGERGMATTDITEEIRSRLGGNVPVTVIPDSGHHIMLDQPTALIAVLQTLLGQWRRR